MKGFVHLCLAAVSATAFAAFDLAQAEISRQLSADAYCGKDNYLSHTYEGAATGFEPSYVIYNADDDTEGYIGYLPSNDSIYVVFRGSVSLTNWITDMTTDKTAYSSFPECNCQVHDGFYHAEQRVIADVVNEVSKLKAVYPTAAIKTTGHSLGAALA
jgi:hypothetical protein